jgi:hypothetical protein
MKQIICCILIACCIACSNKGNESASEKDSGYVVVDTNDLKKLDAHDDDTTPIELYSGTRFKDVTVEKLPGDSFRISGKAQVFEAAFSWVITDGAKELQQGHTMTDAGAPAFGNFSFTVKPTMEKAGSSLHIILFEASAKDGSRQYELPVPLK